MSTYKIGKEFSHWILVSVHAPRNYEVSIHYRNRGKCFHGGYKEEIIFIVECIVLNTEM